MAGFDQVSRANNYAQDFGPLQITSRCVREAKFLETPRACIALVAAA